MRELGVDAYRFSVAWPRIQPDGQRRARTRPASTSTTASSTSCSRPASGPSSTLYHWDLPQALEDAGGWPARDDGRARSATTPASWQRRLGDRVRDWITLNEPWVFAFLGYADGMHAPGRSTDRTRRRPRRTTRCWRTARPCRDPRASRRARGWASRSTFSPWSRHRPPGTTWPRPRASTRPRTAGSSTPLHGRGYPPDVPASMYGSCVPVQRRRPRRRSPTPTDFLGVNYYSRHLRRAPTRPDRPARRRARPRRRRGRRWTGRCTRTGSAGCWPGSSRRTTRRDPHHRERRGVRRRVGADGSVARRARRAVPGATTSPPLPTPIDAGARVDGYLAWSLLDNFEWAYGLRDALRHRAGRLRHPAADGEGLRALVCVAHGGGSIGPGRSVIGAQTERAFTSVW